MFVVSVIIIRLPLRFFFVFNSFSFVCFPFLLRNRSVDQDQNWLEGIEAKCQQGPLRDFAEVHFTTFIINGLTNKHRRPRLGACPKFLYIFYKYIYIFSFLTFTRMYVLFCGYLMNKSCVSIPQGYVVTRQSFVSACSPVTAAHS